jgi:2-methylcitrate dehydratase PrpD
MAALMAKNGYTASLRALEAPRGLLQVFSDKTDWSEVTDHLGQSWEIELNTYKPFACGIVIHPAIDACVQLRERHGLALDQIAHLTLRAHPLVQELTGKKTPQTGLQSKFSVFHSCAVALLYGRAGEHEYSDEVVNHPDVLALRAKVELIVDRSIDEAAVDVVLHASDGRTLTIQIEHAVGSLQKPMSNEQLRAKFVDQAIPVIGQAQAAASWDLCMGLGKLPNLAGLTASLANS